MRKKLEKVFLCCLLGSALLMLTQGAPTKGGTFHESPRDVAVTVGDGAILTCRIKHTRGSPPVQWKFQKDDGRVLVIGIKLWTGKGTISPIFPRCSWVTYRNTGRVPDNVYRIYDLRIKHIQFHDAGKYSCFRTRDKFRSARLDVFPRGMKDISVNQGNSVRLTCSIFMAKLGWWTISKKDGHHKLKPRQQSQNGKATLYSDRVTYDWELNDGESYDIIVSNAQKSDRGVYRCVTSPNRTVVERRLQVLCDGDPVFVRRPHDTYAFLLKQATLRCGAHSRKGGNVIARWKKAKDSRTPYTKYYPFKHNDTDPFGHAGFQWANLKMSGNFDLELFFNTKSSEGFYWCEALPEDYDQFDEVVAAVAELRVFEKPKGSKGQYIPTLQKSFQLKYIAESSHFSCIPKHKVIWLDADLNVLTDNTESTSKDKRFKMSSIFPEDLLISNIQVKDAQPFYCVLAGDSFVWEKVVYLGVQGCSLKNWHFDKGFEVCIGTAKQTFKTTFGGAVRWCRQNNAHLAMPKNSKETNILQNVRKHIWGEQYVQDLWIGLDDIEWEKEWKWADGRLLSGNEHYWSANQPNNRGGYQNCAVMDKVREFKDENCMQRNWFLCESPGLHWNRLDFMKRRRCKKGWISFDCGDLCYWMSKEKMTWDYARDYCERKYSSLAIMRTERHWRSLELMMELGVQSNPYRPDFKKQEAWIGLRKIGTRFEWVDGSLESWSRIKWSPHHSDGDCFSMELSGYVNTRNCLTRKYFVCQRPQVELTSNGHAISVCGRTERSTPIHPTKRDAGPAPVSRSNRTNDQLSIAAIFYADTITIEDVPWAVRVITKGEVVCSGVLVGPKTVLTSGHCVLHKRNRNMSTHDVMVGLGSEDRSARGGRLEPVHMIKVHGNYEVDQFDIAVIELKRRQLTDCWNVRQACLPESKTANYSGFKCKVVSWGYEGALQYCDVNYNNLRLRESTSILFYRTEYHCKLGEADFGAPLICINESAADPKWTLVGIYSEKNGRYFEFTYVPHYLKWIKDKMQGADLPENEFYYEVTCFQGHVDISCDYGRPPLVQVVQAWYGADSQHRCTYQTPKQVGCKVDVTQTLRQRCAAKNRCQFDVTTELFGDPCPHAFEYLTLVYQCVNVAGKHTDFDALICKDGGEMSLTCGQDNQLLISVQKAEFGHGPPGFCPSWRPVNPSCRDKKDVTKEIADRCDGKVFCMGPVSHQNWGDPCPGYEKHLVVGYTCLTRDAYSHRPSAYHSHSSAENLQPSAIVLVLAVSSCLLLRAFN